MNVENLENEEYDFIPAYCGINSEKESVEKDAPLPTWFVAAYKTGQENKHKALQHIQKKAGYIPRTNLKIMVGIC